ncbi:MAG TPA: hemolysin family protein [Pyrinomonadaceae bacterium]|jgi:CBS domain containing-hemolysin-like protein|nr:hemolysin family protein [Pyrinomonadaceae bacterium]
MVVALNILLIFLLVFANGFFVAAEFALVSVRRARIATLAEDGNKRARRVLNILDNLNAYLSAAQLGITIASLGLGSLGEPFIAHLLEGPLTGTPLEPWRRIISFCIGLSIITSLHIVLGEQAPKLLGLERAERVALITAWPMQIFYKMCRWPISALDWASARTIQMLGLRGSGEHGAIYTADELRQLIDASHLSGHLEADEKLLINRVFDFSDAEVREAMIPRTAIVALPVTSTLGDAEKAFCESGYSRLPIYRERLDEIVGVLFMKDLLPCLHTTTAQNFDLEKMMHPPLFVPATARLGTVLGQMQAARTHIAFAVDEHGGIEGIVTLEDLLEEIVGDINDEYDEESRAQITEENGSYILDGMLAVRDANRHLNLKLPEEAGYTTLAGFLLSKAGRLLRPGEAVEHDGALFTIERVDHRRIRRIRLKPALPDSEATVN